MKKAINQIKYAAIAVLGSVALTACVSDEPFELKGEGKVYIDATLSSKLESRSVSDEVRESCMVWISNSKGLVRRYNSMSEVPATGIRLVSDNYVAEAWAGDSVPASKTAVYFKGSQSFTVQNGSTVNVSILCKIANSVVAVDYASNIDDVLSDYVMTVWHSQGSLQFDGRTDEQGFFMMNSRDKDLNWKLTGTDRDGGEFVREGKIEACKPATLYTLKVNCEGTVEEIGGGYLTIEVDESEVTSESIIKIPAAPSIKGFNYDIAAEIHGSAGTIGRRSVFITASTALDRLVIACPGIGSILGISGDDFELFGMSDAVRDRVVAGGINYVYNYDDVEDVSDMKINFEETFTNNLPNGDYPISITATDANGRSATAVLHIVVSDAPVTTTAMTSADLPSIWSNRATISGVQVKNDAEEVGLKYRKYGVSGWTDADVTVVDGVITANLTGLEAGTTYEYVACAKDFIGTDICKFTTEQALQFPNAGFEKGVNLTGRNNPTIIPGYGDESTIDFWDSGNHGSTTMSKNVTSFVTSPVHGGSQALSLNSQFVGVGSLGRFAAGNVFVGKYLKTDGTDGVLGWGRSWTSRPTKLRLYAKYTPVAITSSENAEYPVGDMDKGIIFIAILDNSQLETYDGQQYPFVIKTKSSERRLFSNTEGNVIAYGEHIFDGATAGDGLVEIEIPIEYYRTNVCASYIVCTASASKGGDYFSGGNGSVLIIDDLELVYE